MSGCISVYACRFCVVGLEAVFTNRQRLLLEKNAQDNGFENILFLADDEYSGTNFERPSWKKIVELIENGEVETLIVKDMSCQLLSR